MSPEVRAEVHGCHLSRGQGFMGSVGMGKQGFMNIGWGGVTH